MNKQSFFGHPSQAARRMSTTAKVRVQNTDKADKEVVIFGSYADAPSSIKEMKGVSATDLTVISRTDGSGKTVKELQQYAATFGLVIKSITLNTEKSTQEQCNVPFVFETERNPFQASMVHLIDPTEHKSAQDVIQNIFKLENLDLCVNPETSLKYTVLAGSSVTITFEFYSKEEGTFHTETPIQQAPAVANFSNFANGLG